MKPSHITANDAMPHASSQVFVAKYQTPEALKLFEVRKQHAALNIYSHIAKLIAPCEGHRLYGIWVKWQDLLTYIPDAHLPYARRMRPMAATDAWKMRHDSVTELVDYIESDDCAIARYNAYDPDDDPTMSEEAIRAAALDAYLANIEFQVLVCCDTFKAVFGRNIEKVEDIVAKWSGDLVPIPDILNSTKFKQFK
jgi:hypothetical protein